jgi:O-antigen/teichoic acid export membrane protein
MALAASVVAVTKFKISGITLVIFLAVVVVAGAAVIYMVQRTKRSRPAPPDDWERKPAQRG